jgi:hypothetical protein
VQLIWPQALFLHNGSRLMLDDQGTIHIQVPTQEGATVEGSAAWKDVATFSPSTGAFATQNVTVDDGQGDFTASGNATVGGNLTANGNATVGGNLTVSGTVVSLPNAPVSTTSPAAGTAGSLPTAPSGYLQVTIHGNTHYIAFY